VRLGLAPILGRELRPPPLADVARRFLRRGKLPGPDRELGCTQTGFVSEPEPLPMPDDKEERIRLRAYRIWEDEGRPIGRDKEH
jgi:hypothetical protein